LRYKGNIVLAKDLALKQGVLEELHSLPIAGHSGFHKIYEITKHSFFGDGMIKNIQDFVASCDTWQRNKGEMVKIPGELQPLPIPT
jgi:hypothetical protein